MAHARFTVTPADRKFSRRGVWGREKWNLTTSIKEKYPEVVRRGGEKSGCMDMERSNANLNLALTKKWEELTQGSGYALTVKDEGEKMDQKGELIVMDPKRRRVKNEELNLVNDEIMEYSMDGLPKNGYGAGFRLQARHQL